jgi:shikimate kinase
MERSEIVLIGPMRTGKSTLGKLLAKRLGIAQVSFDQHRWKHYRELGYDDDRAAEFRRAGGMLAWVLYRDLFGPAALERLLSEHRDCVFDLGAGVYASAEGFERARQALAPFRNVVLVLPSARLDESLDILRARDPHPPPDANYDFNKYFLEHPSYYALATHTVYTKEQTPEQVCEAILAGVDATAATGALV